MNQSEVSALPAGCINQSKVSVFFPVGCITTLKIHLGEPKLSHGK